MTRSAPFIAFMDCEIAPTRVNGRANNLMEIRRGTETLGMSVRANPAAGTREVSSPAFVPRNVTCESGWANCQRRATARAGSICPAVPPPATMMRFMRLFASQSLYVLQDHVEQLLPQNQWRTEMQRARILRMRQVEASRQQLARCSWQIQY